MPVPSRMRSVRAAAYASAGIGSSISECGGNGDGGSCGSIEHRVLPDPDRLEAERFGGNGDAAHTFGVGERARPEPEPPVPHAARGYRVRGCGMPRDIPALVAELTLDEKAALLAGEDLWSTVAIERLGIPRSTSPTGRTAPAAPASRAKAATGIDRVLRAVRLGARRDVERRARRARRRGARRRGPHQGVPRAARADGQHPPLAARGPQLRVLLGGPAALGQDRGRVRARRAVAGRRHHGEALRRATTPSSSA